MDYWPLKGLASLSQPVHWKIIPTHGKEGQLSDIWPWRSHPEPTINPLVMFTTGMSQNPDGPRHCPSDALEGVGTGWVCPAGPGRSQPR